MEIKYENERVQKLFSNYAALIKHIGNETARALKKRLDQIRASVSFQSWLDSQLGRPHPLAGNGQYRYYGVSVTSNVRLVLRPETDGYSPESLSKCTVVAVKGVCD